MGSTDPSSTIFCGKSLILPTYTQQNQRIPGKLTPVLPQHQSRIATWVEKYNKRMVHSRLSHGWPEEDHPVFLPQGKYYFKPQQAFCWSWGYSPTIFDPLDVLGHLFLETFRNSKKFGSCPIKCSRYHCVHLNHDSSYPLATPGLQMPPPPCLLTLPLLQEHRPLLGISSLRINRPGCSLTYSWYPFQKKSLASTWVFQRL